MDYFWHVPGTYLAPVVVHEVDLLYNFVISYVGRSLAPIVNSHTLPRVFVTPSSKSLLFLPSASDRDTGT